MSSYATLTDYENYTGVEPADEDAAQRALDKAEVDVDSILGPWPIQPATGRKLLTANTPKTFLSGLLDWQVKALKNAVCAQAQYRETQGEEFFVQGQYDSVSGRFGVSGKLPYIGPQTVRELQNTGLIRTSTNTGKGRRWPRWVDFAVNTDSWYED